ncbi:MAG: hypothetical protein NTZ44_03165 [Candidatus Nomurabacteria bacterium]|nr:hypothetical protein [Candidatus Nomurabacteria bacterium]
MDEIPKILNKQELQEKLTATLEKAIEITKLPNFLKGDAELISNALSASNFDIEQISNKFDSLLKESVKNNPENVRLMTRLLFAGIKIPAMTYYYLEDNKKGILQKNQPHSYKDSSIDTPINLRNGLENNLLVTLLYLIQGQIAHKYDLVVDDKLKARLEAYFNKQTDQSTRIFNDDAIELQTENKILEEKLSLEREFFRLLKEGKVKYEVL